MKKVNLIIVYNKELNKVLMCLRKKDPYKGLFNFVGGKVEANEDSYNAAYRELFEETGISENKIELTHLMSLNYHYNYNYIYNFNDTIIEVFSGVLDEYVTLIEETNKLFWIDTNSNFTDIGVFAGEGNIQHMIYHSLDYIKRRRND